MNLKTIVVGGEHLSPKQEKFRKAFMYLVSGAITTIVNLACFKLFNLLVNNDMTVSVFGLNVSLKLAVNKVVCWVIAVLVAYFLNRITVFRSKGNVMRELFAFAGARVLSFIVFEEGLFLLTVFICTKITGMPSDTAVYTLLGIPVTYADLMNILNMVFVIIANYVLSKLMDFRKEDMEDYSKTDKAEESEESSSEPAEEGTENA